MSWTARITKAPDGELRLQFSEPLRHIDMNRDTARQLAALLVVAADGKRSEPLETGMDAKRQEPPGIRSMYRSKLGEPAAPLASAVLNTPRAENGHQFIGQPTSSQRIDLESIRTADVQPKTAMSGSRRCALQPKTSQTDSECFMAENKQNRVHGVAPLLLTLLALLLAACGGSTGTTSNACPHRTHEVTDASGNPETDASGALVMVDNSAAEDQQICDYLAWLREHVPNGIPDCTAQTGVMGSTCGEAGAGGSP